MAVSRSTRRELLARGLAGGAAGALGVAALNSAAPGAQAAATGDPELLVGLVGIETLAVFVYRHALASGVLSPAGERLARKVLGQEHAHLRAMRAELARVGGTPAPPIGRLTDAERVLSAHSIPGLTDLHDEHDCIILLARVEWLLEGTYLTAISKLHDLRALRLCAQVTASEGQHGVALSELLHPGDVNKAVPSAFVLGTQ